MANNHHATLVVVRDKGVLIRGASGSGKSSLASALIAEVHRHGQFARLVGDDQVYLETCGGHLLGWVPQALAGLIECPPLGPVPIAFEPRALVDLVVDLVPGATIPRLTDLAPTRLEGAEVACLQLPQRSAEMAVHALLQILFRANSASFCRHMT